MARDRYSDEQVAAILARAAELSVGGAGSGPAPGLTHAELEDVARQAGIDADVLARAAADVAAGRGAAPPSNARREIVIDGELDDAGREALFNAVMKDGGVGVRATNPSPRTTRFVGGEGWGRDITVTVGGGKTRLVVESMTKSQTRLGWGLGVVAGTLAAGMAIAAPDLGASAILAAGGVVALLASGLGLGPLFERTRRNSIQRSFDTLAALVEQNVVKRAPAPGATESATESALDDARARQGLAPAPAAEERRAEAQVEAQEAQVERKA